MDFDNNTVNQRIAGYRKLAGFTQEQAANLLNMKRSAYARMEKYGNPSPEKLKQIAELYRVSVATLLYGADNGYRGYQKADDELPDIPPLTLENNRDRDILPLTVTESNAIRIVRRLKTSDVEKIIDFINKIYKDSKKR